MAMAGRLVIAGHLTVGHVFRRASALIAQWRLAALGVLNFFRFRHEPGP